ncbi:elongation factor 1-gamma [Achlya hypogyna]|uniref:Elongation factor 1-gamma n=1 Tax=Achlya hypogyna TaxID=1202772 RepID=A0A1V9YXS1_ACHHY|nr:elongation factor 1-gamma [Achlya hypogyna]
MSYTLYAPQAGSRAFKILIAAEYNGVDLNVPEKFVMGVDNKTPEFLALNPLGKVPVLATPEGPIYESNAIARYVARLRADTGLTGKTFYESGQVDQWVDFVTNEMETPLAALMYPIFGYAKYNHDVHLKALEDIKKSLQILENHLLLRTYFVGEAITLADICVFGALIYPFKFIFDKDFRKPYSNLSRWFSTVANQPEFAAIVGDVPLCDVATVADGAPTKEVKKAAAAPKKEKKEAAPKDDDEFEAPKEKKAEHPLAVLNRESPASMKIDDWKVCYSNTKPLSKAMEWLWANVDLKDYSFWFMKYNYNEENKKMFMTCNAVGGFIQRSDAMRKFSFGVMDVLGAEGGLIEIVGCWMFRGQSVEHMLEANPDAEYYTWTKVENLDDATKARIAAYWCNEDDLEGKPIADGKVFK